mmetsp:Transcript_5175/g.14748  ORF Transcript_5175/g.14748 Transcript_5175/m.14748 type:complete len:250 (-) Transcript_5175:127-876(-)
MALPRTASTRSKPCRRSCSTASETFASLRAPSSCSTTRSPTARPPLAARSARAHFSPPATIPAAWTSSRLSARRLKPCATSARSSRSTTPPSSRSPTLSRPRRLIKSSNRVCLSTCAAGRSRSCATKRPSAFRTSAASLASAPSTAQTSSSTCAGWTAMLTRCRSACMCTTEHDQRFCAPLNGAWLVYCDSQAASGTRASVRSRSFALWAAASPAPVRCNPASVPSFPLIPCHASREASRRALLARQRE